MPTSYSAIYHRKSYIRHCKLYKGNGKENVCTLSNVAKDDLNGYHLL